MKIPLEFSARAIAALHDRTTHLWHQAEAAPGPPSGMDFQQLVEAQHRANYELWHTEDLARSPRASDGEIAAVKRKIDRFNQSRNDLSEQIDTRLLEALADQALPRPEAELHSESPGLMIDRLSILALKIYHTQEELDRPEAPHGHRERNGQRLTLLNEQREDLVRCLDRLWFQVVAGERRFKVYRQLKMYNDPTLNPEIYRKS